MALVVETGGIVAGAESYVTAAEYAAFHLAYFGTAETATEAVQEAALRRAGAYMDALEWSGQKAQGRLQAMAWPRSWMQDREGFAVDATTIPDEVKEAQMLFARAEILEPGALSPNFTASKQKTLIEVKGIRWQAPNLSATASANRQVVTDAMGRIKDFLSGGFGQVAVYRA
jgi:hypothetical protein